MKKWLGNLILHWLTQEKPIEELPLYDFERIRYEIRPCDVLLMEGRNRISEIIKQITQSPWSHACIYIGRLQDIEDPLLREKLCQHFDGDLNIQLVIESYLGKGTIVTPLENYHKDHLRICRPRGLSRHDAQNVIGEAIRKLGRHYDKRQVFDLARFLVRWSIFPRRWRSSLFKHPIGESTKTICTTMIAEAFASIHYPILPLVKQHDETGIELYPKNPRLMTPRDFDYSPYFEIIKYPFADFTQSPYRNLPWNKTGLVCQDGETVFSPSLDSVKKDRAPRIKKDFLKATKIKPFSLIALRLYNILSKKKSAE